MIIIVYSVPTGGDFISSLVSVSFPPTNQWFAEQSQMQNNELELFMAHLALSFMDFSAR